MGQTEKHKCCANIPVPQSCARFRPCAKAGKVMRDGKWYCGIHDPESEKARRAAIDAKYAAESALRQKQWKLQAAAPALLAALKGLIAITTKPLPLPGEMDAAYAAARAAIARAEGTK